MATFLTGPEQYLSGKIGQFIHELGIDRMPAAVIAIARQDALQIGVDLMAVACRLDRVADRYAMIGRRVARVSALFHRCDLASVT
jgi:hypothetical protein